MIDRRMYYAYDWVNQLQEVHEVPADAWTYFAYDSRGNTLRIQEPAGTTYCTYSDAGRMPAAFALKNGRSGRSSTAMLGDVVTMIKYPDGTVRGCRSRGPWPGRQRTRKDMVEARRGQRRGSRCRECPQA